MRQESRMVTLEIDLQKLCESKDKRDYFAIQEKQDPDFEFEIHACFLFGITLYTLHNAKTRRRNVSKARQLCMWYMKHKSPYTLADIGFRYADKDHATVLHACKVIQDLIDTKDVVFYPIIQEFKKQTKYEDTTFFKAKSQKERKSKAAVH